MKSINQVIGKINKKVIGPGCCLGCKQDIVIYDMAIIGGEEKGKTQRFKQGCKCMDKQIAEKIMVKNKRLKKEKAKQRLLDTFTKHSLINKELQRKTLNGYKPQHETQLKAKQTSIQFIQDFQAVEPNNIVFCGPTGVGKSHLAKTITDGVMEKGNTAIFISVPTLLRKIRSSYDQNTDYTEDQILEIVEKIDLLVLDDIGTENNSDWAKEKIFDLVNARQGMSTIYTTNIKQSDLENKLGSRIAGRMLNQETEVITVLGENQRKPKNKK